MDNAPKQNPKTSLPRDSTEHASSGEDSNNSDSRSVCQTIVDEVRRLYQCDKTEILNELIKCRKDVAKLKHQKDVMQLALEETTSETMKIQLDLAYSKRTAACLQDAANKQVDLSSKLSQKYHYAVDSMAKLDHKRVKLIKNIRTMHNEFLKHKEKIDLISKELQERTFSDTNRNKTLQKQVGELLHSRNNLKEQLDQTKIQNQTRVSHYSTQLGEIKIHMAKLNEQLTKNQNCIAREIQTTSVLKKNLEAAFASKLQISSELEKNKIEMTKKEKEMEMKLQEMAKCYQTQHIKDIEEVEAQCSKSGEKLMEINIEIKTLTDGIQKLRDEITKSNTIRNDERNNAEQLKTKLNEMQEALGDRDKEICSLNTMVNEEQKRFEEQKQQKQREISKVKLRMKAIQSQSKIRSNQRQNKTKQLGKGRRSQVLKRSTMNHKSNMKNLETRILKDKLSAVQQTESTVVQLNSTSSNQMSKLDSTKIANHGLSSDSVTYPSSLSHFQSIEAVCNTTTNISKTTSTTNVKVKLHTNSSSSNYSILHQSLVKKRAAQYERFTRQWVNAQSRNPLQQPLPGRNKRCLDAILHQSINLSDVSTINVDDESIMENANISENSSIRFANSCFRKNQ